LASGAVIAVFALTSATASDSIESPDGYDNPIGVPGLRTVDMLANVAFLGAILVALASLFVRYRRSQGNERRQIQVVAWTVCFVLAAIALFELVNATTGSGAVGPSEVVRYVVWLSAVLLIPVSVGVAILRYRLYDLDRVISRTLVYASLTLILGAAYIGLVLVGQAVFSSFADGGDLAIAISTLVVAALFLPLRSRVQRLVDRRFYRRRYDAQGTLEAFGSRLREHVDLETLTADLRGVVDETMQPVHLSIWLREARP
jgi:hypothetical protein